MTTPNNPNAIQVQASGRFSTAGVLQGGSSNVSSVVRNGAGDYTVTMGTEIDVNERSIMAQGINTAGGSRLCVVANETINGFDILTFTNAGGAVDADVIFEVTRTQ